MTDEQLMEQLEAPSGELMTVEGTKLKLSKALFEHHEKMKRSALKLHIPKQFLGDQQPRPKDDTVSGEDEDIDDDDVITEDDSASTSAKGKVGRNSVDASLSLSAQHLSLKSFVKRADPHHQSDIFRHRSLANVGGRRVDVVEIAKRIDVGGR